MLPLPVWGLALGQALLISGNILLVSVTALIGQQIAPSASLITLPVALQFLGLMGVTLPAAHLMRWLGRKIGFLMGNIIGVAGAILAYNSLVIESFALFCLSTFLLGMAIGVGQQYRFAAVESCQPQQSARAIALVMGGGVLAAVLGPNLAVWSQGFFPSSEFIGAFAVLVGLYVFTMLLIVSLPLKKPSAAEQQKGGRSYAQLLRQPILVAAVASGSIGYGIMVLVMTATPLAMKNLGYEFSDIASIIQWHVLGMFLPSFITGRLITRFGTVPIIQLGCALLLFCVLVAQLGTSYWFFWVALVALGVGWNFTFIGATSLLTLTYLPNEKAKVQGMNDFLVFGFSAAGALLAGHLQHWLGWEMLNLVMLPPIAFAMWVVWISRRSHKRNAASSA
ncbi:MFS transporter [Marinospirillum insulare]|uniref:MFS transporter n=1 Tax=Marinospirillum insulare TaxID=217169 RepID=A0ABQ5ZR17_9GAMM|nr:MFS transporter [Marinospirillum insulare]GLR62590.1 MFS transporter [Marinospirillum insulare]